MEEEQESIYSRQIPHQVLNRVYGPDFLDHIAKFSKIDFDTKLFAIIEESSLKRSTKDYLIAMVAGFMSDDSLLASFDSDVDKEIATLTVDQHINRAAVIARKSDTANPEFMSICSQIKDEFEVLIAPRAKGKDRERMIAARVTMENKVTQTIEDKRERKALGLLNRWRS